MLLSTLSVHSSIDRVRVMETTIHGLMITLIDWAIYKPVISPLYQIKKATCVFSAMGTGERMWGGGTYKKNIQGFREAYYHPGGRGGPPLLCSGVNRFHVCLHFIYCSTCCCRHSGHEALWTVATLFWGAAGSNWEVASCGSKSLGVI